MAKQKHKKKKVRNHQLTSSPEKGFDFGEQMKVMAITDLEFNQALSDAGVYACAYGFHRDTDIHMDIPVITLVGKNHKALVSAFDHFANWGCEKDGDVVDIRMMLKNDGSYEMWIGPEIERSMYRTVPHANLCQPLMFNIFWIKTFDSTNPMVNELKQYCMSAISPVLVSAALTNSNIPNLNQIEPISDLPRLIKFDLIIVDENDTKDDLIFGFKKEHKNPHRSEPKASLSPKEYCWHRRRTFDVAFPVSRERVCRSDLLDRIHKLPEFSNVSEIQVVQAVINLMLSAELVQGDRHYIRIAKELPKTLWNHIFSRFETANGEFKPEVNDPVVVAHQLELDVSYVLRQQSIPTTGKKFAELQAIFRERGYVDD